MIDSSKYTKMVDDLAKKLVDAIPVGFKDIKHDLEKNFRSVLQSTFAKLDLVTREEFDTQVNVLKRTRSKLDSMEKKLSALEEQCGVKSTKPSAKTSTAKKTSQKTQKKA